MDYGVLVDKPWQALLAKVLDDKSPQNLCEKEEESQNKRLRKGPLSKDLQVQQKTFFELGLV